MAHRSPNLSLVPIGAVAAVIGGVVWLVKGAYILATGRDELAGVDLGGAFVAFQGLFALAVLAVDELVVARTHPDDLAPGGRRATIGRWASWLSLVLSAVLVVFWALDALGDQAVLGFASVLCSLGWIAGAGLVGLSALRRRALVGPWRWVPLAVGIATIPLLIVFGIASNFLGPRLLEVPVVAVGLAWVALGASLIRGEAIPAA